MNAANDFVRQFLKLITDLFATIWNFAITQISILFSHSWGSLPYWKIFIVLVVVIVVVLYLWKYALVFITKLIELVVSFIYMLPFVFVLGALVFVVNWFIRHVHLPVLDRLG